MALCPFHGEKTASMSFTDVENLFHCFGCKEGGDIFKYVQEINNLEFQDAIEFVAEKYGFKLTYTQSSDNSDFKVYQDKINLINNYFLVSMKSDKSKDARAYLQTRKYDDKDIEKYSAEEKAYRAEMRKIILEYGINVLLTIFGGKIVGSLLSLAGKGISKIPAISKFFKLSK